uniref:Uncharacterized protein n=1 Tax=Arundo donax TaxID=35708 RepID=A0A0A9FUP1_ARUDO
MLSRMKIMCI